MDETLEVIIGPIAMREYTAAPEWDQPKIREWAAGLQTLSAEKPIAECASKILDSALVIRFKGNWEGTHARASACYHEASRRHHAAGHDPACTGGNLYTEGFNRALRSQGHATRLPYPCTCATVPVD